MTAIKLAAFRKKQIPSPTAAIVTPAIAGPTSLAALKIAELSAIALLKWSGSSIKSTTKTALREHQKH